MFDDKYKEKLAKISHEIWAHWMKYLFSICEFSEDPNTCITFCIIPDEYVERWQRQIETEYDKLSEKEKDNDREQANKIMKVLNINE